MDLGAGGAGAPGLVWKVKLVGIAALLYAVSQREGGFLLPSRRSLLNEEKEGFIMQEKKTAAFRSARAGVRWLTLCALLTAMSIVFSRVLSISTGFLRFNLGSLPVILAGVLFGPGAGFAVGAVADIVGGVLSGYAINPLITLGAAAVGLVPGLVWRWEGLRSADLRLAVGILLGHILGSMVINSLALRLFYNYPWSLLAARIPNALILSAAEFALVRLLLANRALMRAVQGTDNGRKN